MTYQASAAARLFRGLRRFSVGSALAVTIAGTALLVWARVVTPADPAASFGLASDDAVIVSRDEWVLFRPRDMDPEIGIIFYPGGKAEPAAYAPMLRAIAAQGYLVVMTPMPLNMAVFAPGRANRVIDRYPAIRAWVIAGHSLGGAMACNFADRHRGRLAGLILWAAYPAPFDDLSDASLPVLSIYASLDALATPKDISETRPLLPADTTYVTIAGGDHWNFGHFRPARGTAIISRETQQAQILDATLAFLGGITLPAAT